MYNLKGVNRNVNHIYIPWTVSWLPNQLSFALKLFLKTVAAWLSRWLNKTNNYFISFVIITLIILKNFNRVLKTAIHELSRSSALHPLHYWDPECAKSPAHVHLVCSVCRWQSHRKSYNIHQGQGECIYILAIFWNCKMVFRFWTFQRVLKSLCVEII